MSNAENPYAVEDLAEFMRLSRKAEKPFIFITGAGCSVTSGIPLAQKIVSELNERFVLELKPLSDEDRKDYGKCMGRLETSKRREYLQEYIGKAKINWAHIALACLMKEGYIRRVLTFNFDNLLARSCGLLGEYPPIYDFTAANLNLHRLIDDPAIVHLHGQGHGFVQLNTESETEEHAARLKEFVGHTLSESPTLFIGYSGKNDAFLPQIEEQFDDQHRLFWVDMGDQAPEHLKNKLLTSSLAHYMSCENGADLFLVELAQELGCFPPTIFADPYQHLLDELEEVANYPMLKEDPSEDKNENRSIRSNTSTQDILLGTKNKLKEVQQQDKDAENDFLQEYLQGDYEEIIQILEGKYYLNHEQSQWLAKAYFSLALRETIVEKQIDIYEKLINRFKEHVELDIREQVAKALVNKGLALEGFDQLDNAIETYNEVIAKFGESDEFGLREAVARAFTSKAITLSKSEQFENAIEVCDELIKRFDDSDEPILQEAVAQAFVTKAATLGRLEQLESAIKVCDEVIKRFDESYELDLQEPVARALLCKVIAFEQLNNLDKTIEACDEIIRKFHESSKIILQKTVAKALLYKGNALGVLEQQESATKVYDTLITKFGMCDELVLQELVATALANKAVILEVLGQPESAVKIYDELIAKFGAREQVTLQNVVARAFNAIGYSKLIEAKKQWRNPDIAQNYLYEASDSLSKALAKSSENDHSIVLGNIAYTEFLRGNVSDSKNHLREALQQGGHSLYDETVDDITKHPIDVDNDFRILLDNIWNEINK